MNNEQKQEEKSSEFQECAQYCLQDSDPVVEMERAAIVSCKLMLLGLARIYDNPARPGDSTFTSSLLLSCSLVEVMNDAHAAMASY